MRVGFYECDITPPLGGDMPGYYGHNIAHDAGKICDPRDLK